jgi:hypothetical protein
VTESILSINAAAKITGQSFEGIQKLDEAARSAGVDVDTTNAALERLNVNVGKARTEGGAAAKAFERWGIAIAGKDNGQIISEIADRMKSMADPAQRAAMAVELMGKTGKDLIPLLENGAKAMQAMGNHGPIFSESERDTIMELNRDIEKGKTNLLTGFADLLTNSPMAKFFRGLGDISVGATNFGKASAEENHGNTLSPTKAANEERWAAQSKQTEAEKKHAENVIEMERKGESLAERYTKDLERQYTLHQLVESGKASQLELDEASKNVQQDQLDIAKQKLDIAKQKAEAEKKAAEAKAHQADKDKEATDLARKIGQNERQLGQQEAEYPTIENLAGRRFTERLDKQYGAGGRFDLGRGNGPLGDTARDYELAQKQQIYDRTYGNTAAAEGDRQRMIADRNKLIGAGAATPEMQMEKMRENTDAMRQHLNDLVHGGAVIKTDLTSVDGD